MATTTSTDNTGLLDYLAPHFTEATGIEIKWTATGTGKALELGKRCDVDVLLVHAPDAEKQYVADGYGINRQPIMYNDFVVIGPKSDPADIRGKTTKAALDAIQASGSRFVSRGDDSGTHKKEIALWQAAGMTPPDKASWYIQTGQGMLPSINIAAEQSGYILTDRGTYIKYAHDKGGSPPLVIVVEGGDMLRNQYSVIQVSPENCPDVKADQARAFSGWMAGKQAQQLIDGFRLLDKKLFISNADQ
jgi:tungstate transport system substrate-binding protein